MASETLKDDLRPLVRYVWGAVLAKLQGAPTPSAAKSLSPPVEYPDPAPYGYCPECRAPGVMAERRLGGNATCANGHDYPRDRAKYASTQVEITGPARRKLLAMARGIPDGDLGEDGRELESHVTCKYGLHVDSAVPVSEVVRGFGPVRLRLGRVSAFRGAESGRDYDVLFAEVDSPDLVRLNALLAKSLPCTDTHVGYHPHATICYVKAGLADQYLATLPAVDEELTVDRITFSPADRDGAVEVLLTAPAVVKSASCGAPMSTLAGSAGGFLVPDGTQTKPKKRKKRGIDKVLSRFAATLTETLRKAFKEDDHPRDDHGQFVSKDDLEAAKSDPAKAAELRKRVTDPEQRKKLDAHIGAEGSAPDVANPPATPDTGAPVPHTPEADHARDAERADGADRPGDGGVRGSDAGRGGEVAGAVGGPAGAGPDQGGHADAEPAGAPTARSVPASTHEVNRRLDRFQSFFHKRGQHQVADWLGKLREHVNAVGSEAALRDLAAGSAAPGGGTPGDVQYWGVGTGMPSWEHVGGFITSYLARNGIVAVTGSKADPSLPQVSALGKPDPYVATEFKPASDAFRNKLDEAQHLPGLETSEDLGRIAGGEQPTHLTPDVLAKLDEKYGKGQWIVKCYDDNAAAGWGIFFPQRATAIPQDARNAIWTAGERLGRYGFKFARDDGGRIVGIEHENGDRYEYGTERYEKTIDGDARAAADVPLSTPPGWCSPVRDNEQHAALPRASFMGQPAFPAVGISDEDRAKGKTWHEKNEGRVHLVTRPDGTVEVIPGATWLKGGSLPVVFEDEHTRAMAKAAADTINALPPEARRGQVYAPDVMKTADGYRVVELNAQGDENGSGYLHDNQFTIDAYTSHLTGREPMHVQFIRQLLSSRKRGAGPTATPAPGGPHDTESTPPVVGATETAASPPAEPPGPTPPPPGPRPPQEAPPPSPPSPPAAPSAPAALTAAHHKFADAMAARHADAMAARLGTTAGHARELIAEATRRALASGTAAAVVTGPNGKRLQLTVKRHPPAVAKAVPPGGPPRPGLAWKESTHRWVHPETGEEHEPAGAPGEPAHVEFGDADGDSAPPPESVAEPLGHGDGVSADHAAASAVDSLPDAIPDLRSPGVWSRLRSGVLTAASNLYGRLVRATPALHRVLTLIPDALLDTPSDLAKLGYAPQSLGSATANRIASADPVHHHVGVSAHLAATVASHVLARALVWAKRKLRGGGPVAKGDYDWLDAGAEELTGLVRGLYEDLGLDAGAVDAGAIRAALAGLAGEEPDTTAGAGDVPAVEKAATAKVRRKITVHRGGKTFTEERLVNAGSAAPAAKAGGKSADAGPAPKPAAGKTRAGGHGPAKEPAAPAQSTPAQPTPASAPPAAHLAAPEEHAAAKAKAQAKIRSAPVPPPEKVKKNRGQLAAIAADAAERKRMREAGTPDAEIVAKLGPAPRPGGDSRGSSADRKARAKKLFAEFGGAEKGYVVCHETGRKLHWTDDPAENPHGYPKFEQGKIFTFAQGGSYTFDNLLPESFECNRSRNDAALRTENTEGIA